MLARLQAMLPRVGPPDVGIGDDAAVLAHPPAPLLVAADVLVEGVHWDPALSSAGDAGWKAVSVNVSDIAAMGGRPLHLVITVVAGPGLDLDAVYGGVAEACAAYGCVVVGGDLSAGAQSSISVTVTGTTDGRAPVPRSGARPGDAVVVTGPLGAAAAELDAFRAGRSSPGGAGHHRRPAARVEAGIAAAVAGATAMIDVSDGFLADLGHVLDASGVGVELDEVPVAAGATDAHALAGGDDYELVITTPDPAAVVASLEAGGAEPAVVGRCVADAARFTLAGSPVAARGWEHDLR